MGGATALKTSQSLEVTTLLVKNSAFTHTHTHTRIYVPVQPWRPEDHSLASTGVPAGGRGEV